MDVEENFLVVAPHADDEVLGAGGLLAKLAKHGVAVRVVYLAVDGFRHYGLDRSTTLSERKAEILEVASLLNFDFRIGLRGTRSDREAGYSSTARIGRHL
ncbi:MAG: PIG-L deacetylase family protein [Gammaproteobacteria bacterium]